MRKKIDKQKIDNIQIIKDKQQMIDKKTQKNIKQNQKPLKSTYRIINQQVRLTPIKRLKQKCQHMLPERFKIKKRIAAKLKDLSPVITARLKTSQQNSINFQTSFITVDKQQKSISSKNFRLTSRIRQKYKQKFRYISQQKKRASSIALPNFSSTKGKTPPSNLLNKNLQFDSKVCQKKKRKFKSYSQSLLSYASKNNQIINGRQNKNSSGAINNMLRMTKIKQMYNMMGEQRRKSSKIIQKYNNLSVQSRKLTIGKDKNLSKSQCNQEIKNPCHIHTSNRLKNDSKNIIAFKISHKNNLDVLDRIERMKNNRIKNLQRLQQSFNNQNNYNQGMITRWELHNQFDYRHEADDQFYGGKFDEFNRQRQKTQRKYESFYSEFEEKKATSTIRTPIRTPIRKISKSNIIN